MSALKSINVLINMSNIHGGGALQVAVSFVTELLLIDKPNNWQVNVLISDEIKAHFSEEQLIATSWSFINFNTHGFKSLFSKINFIQSSCDVVYTLFGPKYTWLKAKLDIVGFAQLWILNFNNSITDSMPFLERSFLRFKFFIQEFFFRKADHVIVELDHVKKSLVEKKFFESEKISIVYNSLSNLYFDSSSWRDVSFDVQPNEIAIGFVTRDYKHKNIKILQDVANILHKKFSLPVCFYFTLDDVEWSNYKSGFGNYGKTVGSLNVYQCPRFYEKMHAVIFPSLLECFSATPLEALAMKKPLFASDRGFVRDVCSEHAMYFNPLSADDIANVIVSYFNGPPKTDYELEISKNHVLSFSNSTQRAKDYLRIISQQFENVNNV